NIGQSLVAFVSVAATIRASQPPKIATYTIIARLKLHEGRLITCRFDRISIRPVRVNHPSVSRCPRGVCPSLNNRHSPDEMARQFWCGRWDSNPHDVAIEGF